ncbi:MAG: DUF4149 domain-containing protein [Clostridia bacterium]|nr:DUF4149 domain-containing protein [Clostridia bacterium]
MATVNKRGGIFLNNKNAQKIIKKLYPYSFFFLWVSALVLFASSPNYLIVHNHAKQISKNVLVVMISVSLLVMVLNLLVYKRESSEHSVCKIANDQDYMD